MIRRQVPLSPHRSSHLNMQRAIDLRGAVAINVITMIGIGPLVTIPLVVAALGGPLAVVGWIAGAVVASCDGLVWAELSSRFPGSGGTYVYLRAAFGEKTLGRALAFLFNWQFLLYAPCLLASGYIGFANYAAYVFPPAGSNPLVHDAIAIGIGAVTIFALYRRTSRVAAVGTVLAAAAVLTLVLVIVAALTHAHFGQAFTLGAPVRFNAGLLAGFGSALYITLYDYVGYADVALLGDEVVRPQRTIPTAILLSIAIVAVLYVLLQIGVLGVIPWRSLLGHDGTPTPQAQYVGSLVVELTWGRVAAIGVTVLVLVTAFASVYGNLLGFSRIPFAAARDGAFLPQFARLHPRKDIPHVALLSVGALSLIASVFTLDQVIAFLTAGIVLVQGIAQIIALFRLRARSMVAPFRMPLFPLPALIALAGWTLAFIYTGPTAIALGVGWLVAGAVVFAFVAHAQRWWPFAAMLLAFAFSTPGAARAQQMPAQWAAWNASSVVTAHGYPVFAVGGKPFFVYGAAFFYERVPRVRWLDALRAYARAGINTIDLYAVWNWQQPAQAQPPDFNGATDPRRDFVGALALCHRLGLKVVLRPGPVIRNEWRNGGYPAWLLELPEYNMPLHDVLEGRYPATATLQNTQADAAGDEWLRNATHLRGSQGWLRSVLRAAAPYAGDVIAVALDDDQGAYLDNDTWPAPRWHAYIDWLRLTVQSVIGTRVPVFVNTFEMKVPAASPAWAWGDWYQSDAYAIGAHDLAQLDFATGLLQTQPAAPVMYAEFQAGWLQSADEALPRPSDPANTALALGELLRDGVHGIVNFPLQDTIYPDGWEAPWANWSYAWDAALTSDLQPAARYEPTAAFGEDVRRYGTLLARTHVAADAGIIWPPSLFWSLTLTNRDFRAFADATIAMQHDCNARGLSCELVDLAYAGDALLDRYPRLLLPIALSPRLRAAMVAPVARTFNRWRRRGRIVDTLASPDIVPRLRGGPSRATLLLADDDSYAFIEAVNPSSAARTYAPGQVALAGRDVAVAPFDVAPRSARLVPVGLAHADGATIVPVSSSATPPPFADDAAHILDNGRLRVAFAPNAGARISELAAPGFGNVATSIGLLRDATAPEPPASERDYIAAYTHPLPAGTFNRTYECASPANTGVALGVACSYDAPDIPAGGARFERSLTLGGDELVVDERFVPADPVSPAKLVSISGFAYRNGDVVLAPPGANFVGILRGRRLAAL
ncbi:MAG: amino acid permease, partial [Candidatus Tumulicola sp.]